MTWLDAKPGEDVQQAIDTQTLQTTLEQYARPDDKPFSVFPKAIKCSRPSSINGWTANIWNSAFYEPVLGIQYNYGGFNFATFSGIYASEIVIPEIGIYLIQGQISWSALPAGATRYLSIWVNGAQTKPHAQPMNSHGDPNNSVDQVHDIQRLNAGDRVSMQCLPVGFSSSSVSAGDYDWLAITKLHGQG